MKWIEILEWTNSDITSLIHKSVVVSLSAELAIGTIVEGDVVINTAVFVNRCIDCSR